VDPRHSVLRLPARGPAVDLHDERPRERARSAAEIIKTRGHFPTDEAAIKLIWLALRNITGTWERVADNWCSAINQFAILYEDRFPLRHTSNDHAHGRRRHCGRRERARSDLENRTERGFPHGPHALSIV
jgi:hypothetical protein